MKKSELKRMIRLEAKKLQILKEEDITSLDKKQQKIIINQFEALRRNGSNNMLNFLAVQREANDAGFYEFVSFTANDSKNYSSILKNFGKLSKKYLDEDLVEEYMDEL